MAERYPEKQQVQIFQSTGVRITDLPHSERVLYPQGHQSGIDMSNKAEMKIIIISNNLYDTNSMQIKKYLL